MLCVPFTLENVNSITARREKKWYSHCNWAQFQFSLNWMSVVSFVCLPGTPHLIPWFRLGKHTNIFHDFLCNNWDIYHLICDCCMSNFSSPLLKIHSNSRFSEGLAITSHITDTSSCLAAPNTSLFWLLLDPLLLQTGASDVRKPWN